MSELLKSEGGGNDYLCRLAARLANLTGHVEPVSNDHAMFAVIGQTGHAYHVGGAGLRHSVHRVGKYTGALPGMVVTR